MPSSLAHAMLAVAAGSAVAPRTLLKPVLVVGAACAVLPDVDAIGRWWSFGDMEFLGGHRGFTHSLSFAALAGVACGAATLPLRRWHGIRLRFAVYVAVVTASHGVLDALSSTGAETSPPQFFSPFSAAGYVSPWRPIRGPFSELFYLLVPLAALTRLILHVRGIEWPLRVSGEVIQLDLR